MGIANDGEHDKGGLLSAFLTELGLNASLNEFLMFHGTNPTAAASICENDFQLDRAGSNAGTLYGRGLYFGERSTKADEYAGDDNVGVYRGLYAMLLCRVVCGRCKYTEEVRPNLDDLLRDVGKEGPYHSVIGDREKARGTFREFIIYDKNQVYPQFVVIYRRKNISGHISGRVAS